MDRIDRSEIERILDDLETKKNDLVKSLAKADSDIFVKNVSMAAGLQYSIDRLRELL